MINTRKYGNKIVYKYKKKQKLRQIRQKATNQIVNISFHNAVVDISFLCK